jgi:hypothetical protein
MTIEQHRVEGVNILIDLENATTPAAAGLAVTRERRWAERLLDLLEPAAALMEPLSPFRAGEQIGVPVPRMEALGRDWAMSWQCHHARLYRLVGLLEARQTQRRKGMATRKADDSRAHAKMAELIHSMSLWKAAGEAVPLADRGNGGSDISVQKRLHRTFPHMK